MSRLSQSVGANFESFLDSQHDAALRLGILAWVHHTQAVTKIVHGRLRYIAKGAADYSGVLVDARALAVEAKSTTEAGGTRLPRSEIDVLQAKHLDAVSKVGGLALLAVEFRLPDGCARFVIPWDKVPWKVLRSAESLSLADCDDSYKIDNGECYLSWFVPLEHRRPGEFSRKRVYPRE